MNNIIKSSLLLSLLAFVTTSVAAQCNPYFDYREGTVMTMSFYDKKDNVQGTSTMKVTEATENGDEIELKIISEWKSSGKKSETAEMPFTYTCKDGEMNMDINAMMNQAMADAGAGDAGMSIEINGDKMQFPKSLSDGEQLKDLNYSITMKVEGEGMGMMAGMMPTTDVKILDRKVEGTETITTPAGTFECFVLSSKTISETKTMGMKRKDETSEKVYLSKTGEGVVKLINYDKKGKVAGYQLLTAFDQ